MPETLSASDSPSSAGASAIASAGSHPPVPGGRLAGAILLNWLVPGSGFLLVGEAKRALALMLMFAAVFATGLGLRGGVVKPEWNPKSETFNIINVLTFVVQMGGGAPTLASLAAQPAPDVRADTLSPLRRFFAGQESHAAFDLGSFHLLLVGAMNYFACCFLFDRFGRTEPADGPPGDGKAPAAGGGGTAKPAAQGGDRA